MAVDRKARIREYRETRRPMGIFRVHNKVEDRSLVGASTDLPAMLNRQRSQLRFGAHMNRALQGDWQRLGPDAFEFEVLDTLTPADPPDLRRDEQELAVLEQLWLERLSPFGERGYNGVAPRDRPPASEGNQ